MLSTSFSPPGWFFDYSVIVTHGWVISSSCIGFKLEAVRCLASLPFKAPSAEKEDNMKPNVSQQGKRWRQGKHFTWFQLLEVFLIAGFCKAFSLPLRFIFFIWASSMRFDLANLWSVEIFRPLLNGGAWRNLSIEWQIPLKWIYCNLHPFSFSLVHNICEGFDPADLFSSLQAGFEFVVLHTMLKIKNKTCQFIFICYQSLKSCHENSKLKM